MMCSHHLCPRRMSGLNKNKEEGANTLLCYFPAVFLEVLSLSQSTVLPEREEATSTTRSSGPQIIVDYWRKHSLVLLLLLRTALLVNVTALYEKELLVHGERETQAAVSLPVAEGVTGSHPNISWPAGATYLMLSYHEGAQVQSTRSAALCSSLLQLD